MPEGATVIAIFKWSHPGGWASLGSGDFGTFTPGNRYDLTADVEVDAANSRIRYTVSTVDDGGVTRSFVHFQPFSGFNPQVGGFGIGAFAPARADPNMGYGQITITPLADIS